MLHSPTLGKVSEHWIWFNISLTYQHLLQTSLPKPHPLVFSLMTTQVILMPKCLQISFLSRVKTCKTIALEKFLNSWNIFRINLLETVSVLPFLLWCPFLLDLWNKYFRGLFVSKEHDGELEIFSLSAYNLLLYIRFYSELHLYFQSIPSLPAGKCYCAVTLLQ